MPPKNREISGLVRQPSPPQAGQSLAVAAPASAFDREAFAAGLDTLGRLLPGREVRIDPEVYAKEGYFAGGDQDRAAHLARLMSDPSVGAVVCARGGFGTSRLLPLLDLDALAESGKLLMGFFRSHRPPKPPGSSWPERGARAGDHPAAPAGYGQPG